jgi:DNA damage-inducible protein 1
MPALALHIAIRSNTMGNPVSQRCIRRPRVTVSTIAGTQGNNDGEILSLDLPADLTVGDLKAFIQAETGVDPESQHLYFNNRPMRDNNQKIEAAGIKDGDMIAMVLRNNQAQPQQNSQGFQDRRAPNAEAQRIEGIRHRLVQSPQAMAQLRAQQPAMASVVHDPERFRAVWQEMENHDRQLEGERRDEIDLLNGDFMNVDNQKKIEEMIRQQQVMENLQFAYTHSPEGE